MSSCRNAFKGAYVYLCSCFIFGFRNYINEKGRQENADKNIVKEKKQIKEPEKISRFEKRFAICENINEKKIGLVTFKRNNLDEESNIKENEVTKEFTNAVTDDVMNEVINDGEANRLEKNVHMDGFLEKEKKEVHEYSEEKEHGSGEERSFEAEETKKEEIEADELTDEMKNLIEGILSKYSVVLFMKGTALNPFCKYSKEALRILKLNRVKEIHTVNILNDLQLKRCLKIYSNWSTFPQLYVHGRFIGGVDRIKELHENKQLQKILEQKQP